MRSRKWILGLLGLFILSPLLEARVAIKVKNPDQIYSKPADNAARVRSIKGQENFKAYWQSPDRKWIYISNGTSWGWVVKSNVEVISQR